MNEGVEVVMSEYGSDKMNEGGEVVMYCLSMRDVEAGPGGCGGWARRM